MITARKEAEDGYCTCALALTLKLYFHHIVIESITAMFIQLILVVYGQVVRRMGRDGKLQVQRNLPPCVEGIISG
jgi:hypothetical protein